jgi:hypothetical protein
MVGAQSKRVKEKGRVEKMTLAELLKFARVCEEVTAFSKVEEIKVKQENLANALSTEKICQVQSKANSNRLTTTTSSSSGNRCQQCGYDLPHRKPTCPAVGEEYRKCGTKGHFSSMCSSKTHFKKASVKALITSPQRAFNFAAKTCSRELEVNCYHMPQV